jgi:hypothetical protein
LEEDSDDHSTLSTSALIVPPEAKRKRGRPKKEFKKQKPIVLPRIVNSDIRRKYCTMMANVINSTDFQLIESFFSKYRSRSIVLSKRMIVDPSLCQSVDGRGVGSLYNSDPNVPYHVRLSGLELVIAYFKSFAMAAPDLVVRPFSSELYQRSDTNKTELRTTFTFAATRFYDVNPVSIVAVIFQKLQELEANHTAFSADKKRRLNEEISSLSSHDTYTTSSTSMGAFSPSSSFLSAENDPVSIEIESQFAKLGIHDTYLSSKIDIPEDSSFYAEFPKLDQPSPFHVKGRLVFVFDEHKRIERLDFDIISKAGVPLP